MQLNEEIIKEFLELTSIGSESFQERAMADMLTRKLKDLGFDVYEDDAGRKYGSETGNIYGYLPGTTDGEPLLFSAHMDTVRPGIGKKPSLHPDGTITSDGTTVLGADDAAGLAEILTALCRIILSGDPHRPVEVLFPIAEEVYIKGSSAFDYSRIRSKQAYVLDMSGDVGSAAVKAPSLIKFRVTVTGKAAHAGFSPALGINALEVMCKAVASLKQGQVDDETTFNIGKLSGGTALNIVPEKAECIGETRSFSHKKVLRQIELMTAAFNEEANAAGASVSIETETILEAYELSENEPVISRFRNACANLGLKGELRYTLGGSDNHNFIKNGIRGVVISCGMYNVHSTREYIKAEELIRGAELVAELIRSL